MEEGHNRERGQPSTLSTAHHIITNNRFHFVVPLPAPQRDAAASAAAHFPRSSVASLPLDRFLLPHTSVLIAKLEESPVSPKVSHDHTAGRVPRRLCYGIWSWHKGKRRTSCCAAALTF
jgi:hypothetical protein